MVRKRRTSRGQDRDDFGSSRWRPYVSVAERRDQAATEVARQQKKGVALSPVRPEGRGITKSFWGKAWCDNLERYQDYANRLPRGRTYLRNGSVIDLWIEAGVVTAKVQGSSLYKVTVKICALADARWNGGLAAFQALLQSSYGRIQDAGSSEAMLNELESVVRGDTALRGLCDLG